MGDLKYVVETFIGRLSSPIYRSVFIALAIANWKLLFYVFFANVGVMNKFDYFDRFDKLYWQPILLGIVAGLIAPYIATFGKWAATMSKVWNNASLGFVDRRIAEVQNKHLIKIEIQQLELTQTKKDRIALEEDIKDKERKLMNATIATNRTKVNDFNQVLADQLSINATLINGKRTMMAKAGGDTKKMTIGLNKIDAAEQLTKIIHDFQREHIV